MIFDALNATNSPTQGDTQGSDVADNKEEGQLRATLRNREKNHAIGTVTLEKRIPSLDGLRAISILLVISGHATDSIAGVLTSNPLFVVLSNAGLGVTVFFVISGYLITTLLLQEHARGGKISLRNFYMRRVLRIFPPFYTYIAVLGLLALGGFSTLTRWDFLSALTFTVDYTPKPKSWPIQHVWSLSVEEQFYLLWPFALVLCLRYRNRLTAAKVACALIIAAPFLRLLSHFVRVPHLANNPYYMLHTRMDSLMFGCLAALMQGTDLLERVYRYMSKAIWTLPVFVCVVSPLLAQRLGGAYIYLVGYSLEGAGIALTMLWLVRNQKSVAGRIFNCRGLVHIGLLSYSVYIWQQFFLFLGESSGSVLGKFPINLLCVVVVAELSYWGIEKPILQWRKRHKIGAQRTPSRGGMLPSPEFAPGLSS